MRYFLVRSKRDNLTSKLEIVTRQTLSNESMSTKFAL